MAKNEAKIRFTAETGEFNSAIKKSNDEMSQLRAELKLNETQMKATGATVEKLEEQHDILSRQLAASEDKTQALSQKVDKAAEIFGENSVEVGKLRTQLINAQTAEERIRQAIAACNEKLEEQRNSANEAGEAHESLAEQISQQQDDLDKLKRRYVDVVTQHGKYSEEARTLAGEIKDLSGELKDNQYALGRAERAADDLDATINDVADSARDAGDGFTVFKGVLADLASTGIQAVIGGIRDIGASFLDLSENTKETRTAFAKLETSFDSAGLEADNAYDTIYDLYGVLGDTDRATEASNLLAKICDDEQELDEYTRILTGTFALYGDSIPTEGLAEGISATAEMGVVQGVLADALEWQGINLDNFNAKLEEMNSTEERSAYIKDTLTGLYGEAADAYRENNANLIEANESQLRYNESLAELGEKSEPVTTGLRDGFSYLLTEVRALADDVDFEAIGASIEGAFRWFGEEMLPAIVDGVKGFVDGLREAKTWIEEHSTLMLAVATAVGIVAVAIGAYNVVQGVKAAMDAAQVTTVWALVAAHLAQAGAAMAALAPYILIVAAIAAVIAIIVVCIKYWDEIVEAVKRCWEACMETLATWANWIDENVIQPVINFFVGLWDGIVSIFQSVVQWVKDNWKNILLFIVNPFAGAFKYLYENFEGFRNFVNNIVTKVGEFFSNLWNGFKDGAKSAWNGVKSVFSAVGGFFSNVFGIVKDKIVSVFQAGGTVFSNIKDGIVSVFKTVVNGIIRGINKVISTPFKGLNKVLDTIHGVSVAGIRPFSWLTWRAPVPQIPLLAEGGILTKPTLNIAGEAGTEAIIPIEKLENYISSAINKTASVMNMNALANAIEELANRPVVLTVNGRNFATATASDGDSVNGLRTTFKNRGLAVK